MLGGAEAIGSGAARAFAGPQAELVALNPAETRETR